MMRATQLRFGDAFASAMGALMDVHVTPIDEPPAPMDIVAVLGITGAGMRGSIGIAAGHRTAEALHPSADGEVRARLAEDWLGEIANQLAGRTIWEMSRSGVILCPGTPVVLRGFELRVARPRRDAPDAFVAATRFGPVIGWFDLLPPDWELEVASEDDSQADAEPGSSFFF